MTSKQTFKAFDASVTFLDDVTETTEQNIKSHCARLILSQSTRSLAFPCDELQDVFTALGSLGPSKLALFFAVYIYYSTTIVIVSIKMSQI